VRPLALLAASVTIGLAVAALATPAAGEAPPAPIRSPAAGAARGTVLLVHGGGWVAHGPQFARRAHRRHAARLNALGFDTVAITYRPGADALGDVIAAYDALRRRAGAGPTVCALGDSAGGHLALMLAVRRPSLDCAISRGAPTDLRHAHGTWRDTVTHVLARWAPLARISPANHAEALAGRVLASHARHDPVVAHDQLVRLRRAGHGRIATMTLPSGAAPYVHAPVDPAALGRLEAAEARLLARADGQP
jgi:acetyl esterase/lipase